MTENEIKDTALPQADENKTETEKTDTTPQDSKNEIFIPVKFNKEIRNLNVNEAGILAQKGLKYETIEKDYNALKELANEDNKSVPAFLAELTRLRAEDKKTSLKEKCSGDSELANHILNLEGKILTDNGFAELRESFPEIESTESLPPEVLQKAELKGTLLLDEYLRYLLSEKKAAEAAALKQKTAEKASTGSLMNQNTGSDPETEEFLRGLWK